MLKKIITLIAIFPLAAFAMEKTMEQEKQQTNSTLLAHLGQNAKSLADLEGIDSNIQSNDGTILLSYALEYCNEPLINIILSEKNLKFLKDCTAFGDPITYCLHKRRFAELEEQELYSNLAKKLIVKKLAEFPADSYESYYELMSVFDYALITYNYGIVKFIYESPLFKTIHPEIQTGILEKILAHTKLTNNHISHQEFQVEYEKFSELATQMKSFNLDQHNVTFDFDTEKISALLNNETFQNYSAGIQYKILDAIQNNHNYFDLKLGRHISRLIVKLLFKTRITLSTVSLEPTINTQSTTDDSCTLQ